MKLRITPVPTGLIILSLLVGGAFYAGRKHDERTLHNWSHTPCRTILDTNYQSANTRSANIAHFTDNLLNHILDNDSLLTEKDRKAALKNAYLHQRHINQNWAATNDLRLPCCVQYQSTHNGPWKKEQ